MTQPIPLAIPHLGGNESEYVHQCLSAGMVSSVGEFVPRFEREFAAVVGARHAIACASGTAALHVALQVAGVTPGDEVFVSDFTFMASVNAVSYLNARPVLVDSETDTWNMDPDLLRDELNRRRTAGEPMPKAVELVHVLGQPAATDRILAIAEDFGVAVVEDAAEALGATVGLKHVGTFGRLGAFSFNGNKIMTTGGGGMIVTDDPELAARAKHLTTQAKIEGLGYLHDEVGYNYRLTNVAAALGVAQLEQLPQFLARKRSIANRYDAALADLDDLTLPPRLPSSHSTYWLYSVLLGPMDGGPATRDAIMADLRAVSIDARPLWRPIHLQPPYAGVKTLGGAVGQDLFARGLSLPCSVALTDDQQNRVLDVLRSRLPARSRELT